MMMLKGFLGYEIPHFFAVVATIYGWLLGVGWDLGLGVAEQNFERNPCNKIRSFR